MNCKDESGEDVDWFIVYKLPQNLEESQESGAEKGFVYAFVTDRTVSTGQWIISEKGVNDKDCIFGQTLKKLFTKKKTFSYILYSDDPPGKSRSTYAAHAKGVFASDRNGGFWLSHSIPEFPNMRAKKYSYPSSGEIYGQTAICVSIGCKIDNYNKIGEHILMMRPYIYRKKITKLLMKQSNVWEKIHKKQWNKENDTLQTTFTSEAGVPFQIFAKSMKFESDIYSELIAPSIKRDMWVQSWRNGNGGKLDSDCKSKYKVNNVDNINLNGQWEFTKDHSKWGITVDSRRTPFTCIGDMNRVASQFDRGGGSICSNSGQVWKLFKNIIESVESCVK